MVAMRSQRSKEDDVQKISTSVFVTNFPDRYGAKDLLNTCKIYGHVVDAYIPDRRSKAGKRFGFVRFINVFDVEHLVKNLCTMWVGNFKIHANVARFQRESVNNIYQAHDNGTNVVNGGDSKSGDGFNGTIKSYAHVLKRPQVQKEVIDDVPTMVLDETCLNKEEYSLCLLGKVKEFASLTNLKVVLAKEGFDNIELKYMGGFWVMIVFQEEETKKRFQSNDSMGSWWGTILNDEVLEEGYFHNNRLCICTKNKTAVFESFKLAYRGKVCWVRAIEVLGWVPDFEEDSDDEYESNEEAHAEEV
ncbi:nucleotide-binding alpha-beta plait domain-containing protein [Tanacetum coccineum]